MTCAGTGQIGDWRLDPLSGDLDGPAGRVRLEPKLLDLLRMLAEAEGQVLGHAELLQALWPGMIVGDDTIARSISRLRRALDDDARAPRYIETLPKRGYRLLAPVRRPAADEPGEGQATSNLHGDRLRPLWIVLAILFAVMAAGSFGAYWWSITRTPEPLAEPERTAESELLARADDHYAQYQFPDNEAALLLYERVLQLRPDHPPALAGLANALVQKAMRWPQGGEAGTEFTRLRDALAAGHLQSEPGRRLLDRARGLAEEAIRVDPGSTIALRAYGLAASAQEDFDAALDAYRRALDIDPEAWAC